MQLPYTVVDVFTDQPLAGNQLAVFTQAEALSSQLMQRLAREMSFAETTFFVGRGAAGHRVRIFTPEVELPFAGHPALGTAVTLLAMEGVADGRILLELGVGIVPVTVTRTPFGARAELLAPVAAELPCALGPEAIAAAIGLPAEALDPSLPPAVWSCGNPFLLVALRESSLVARARLTLTQNPDGWPLGLVVHAVEGTAVHARVFIPGSAVAEDPATGSANAPLAARLHAAGRLAEGELLVTRQGVEMGRPSRLEARMVRDEAGLLRPSVAGGVVTVAAGAFTL